MDNNSHEPGALPPDPDSSGALSPWALADDSPTRHDGWTGERMAKFCEVLADTGLVTDACLAAGKSTNTAYATRRRNPVFAAAWEAALTIARERLADTLLSRSIEGTLEQYYKDGELVAEKRVIDNRLGLAILTRLDRMAHTGSPLHSNLPAVAGQNPSPVRPACPEHGRGERSRGTVLASPPLDWDLALDALRTGDPDAVAAALAMLNGGKAHEAHDPPIDPPSHELCDDEEDEEEYEYDPPERVWQDQGEWWTNFPPPIGFDRYQKGKWGDYGYKRFCSDEEEALLQIEAEADRREAIEADDQLRDQFFDELTAELTERMNADLAAAARDSGAPEEAGDGGPA